MESEGLEQEEEYLECFRCDLGFWDACYTTETNCSRGELCYTGRGKTGALNSSEPIRLKARGKMLNIFIKSESYTEYSDCFLPGLLSGFPGHKDAGLCEGRGV